MSVIIVCTNNKKTILFNEIKEALSNYGKVLQINNDKIYCNKSNKNIDYVMIKSDCIPTIKGINGVVVFDESFKSKNKIINEKHSSKIISIFDSSDKEIIKILNNCNFTAIPCGANSKDTFSVSSVSMDSATISLQREITDILGKSYEPHEFKVTFRKEKNMYILLIVCATLLLSGISSENGYII